MSPLKEINAIFIESNKLINFLYSSIYSAFHHIFPRYPLNSGYLRIGKTICHPHGTGRCFAIAENQPN